jgi:hypothetical protein
VSGSRCPLGRQRNVFNMDFDFFFKLVVTASFFGVSLCLCIKWVVESYLDWIQVKTGINIVTLEQEKETMRMLERLERRQRDDDDLAN